MIVLVAPVPDGEFLHAAVEAAERAGYVAMVVVVAREADADAKPLLESLVDDWASLDDVLTEGVGLLCPLPEESLVTGMLPVDDEPGSVVIGTTYGARGVPHAEGFRSELAEQLRASASDLPSLIGPAPSRPLRARQHRDAWSGSAGVAAGYLGLSESQVPSVVVLCYEQKTAVVIPAVPGLRLYDLVKRTVIAREAELAGLRSARQAMAVASEHPDPPAAAPDVGRRRADAERGLATARAAVDLAGALRECVTELGLGLQPGDPVPGGARLQGWSMIQVARRANRALASPARVPR